MCILVLENDPLIAQLLAAVFLDRGWDVCTADRLADARAHLATGRITVVLADKFLLPGEDGHDFAFRIRDIWQDVAVIYMTGGPVMRPDHLLRDREWSVSKPFDIEQVAQTVDEARSMQARGATGSSA